MPCARSRLSETATAAASEPLRPNVRGRKRPKKAAIALSVSESAVALSTSPEARAARLKACSVTAAYLLASRHVAPPDACSVTITPLATSSAAGIIALSDNKSVLAKPTDTAVSVHRD